MRIGRSVPLLKILLLLLVAVTTFPALARAETFGIFSFTPPTGWQKTVVENDHVLYTGCNAARSAFCQLLIFESQESAGNPLKDFESEWNALILKDFKAAYEAKPKVTESGTGWTAVMSSAHVSVKDVVPFVSILISFTGSGRVGSVVINVSDLGQFSNVIDTFTNSLVPIAQSAAKPAAPKAPPPAPSPAPAPPPASAPAAGTKTLVGMWQGIGTVRTTTGITNAAGTGYSLITTSNKLRTSRIVFFPDGNFCGVIPQAGFDGMDLNAERARVPNYWGTYTFSNGKGNIVINGSSTPFELKDNKVTYGGMEFEWHYPSADGLRFAGTFTAEKDPSRYNGPEPTLTFTLDGRFTDNGAIYWMRHVRSSTEDQSDKMLGSGTYAIKNYTMTFTYSDGRVIRLAFIDASGGDPKNPQQVRFDTLILDRK